MKMKSRSKSKGVRYGVIFIVLILALELFSPWSPHVFLQSVFMKVARPLFVAQTWTSDGTGFFGIVQSKTTLLKENAQLKEKLFEAELALFDRTLLQEEIIELRTLLNRTDTQSFIYARVLAESNQSPYDTLIIDAGKKQGVFEGDHVVVGESLSIVGRIERVFDTTSLVVLYSSPDIETTAYIPSAGITTVAYGQGAGNFLLRIPQSATVEEGAIVTLPGKDSILGIVGSVYALPADSFKTVRFVSQINIFNLSSVLIKRDSHEVMDTLEEVIQSSNAVESE